MHDFTILYIEIESSGVWVKKIIKSTYKINK